MVVYYQIAGKKVGSHVPSFLALRRLLFGKEPPTNQLPAQQLSMATLGTMFAGSWLAMGGGDKPKTAQGPPISASSKDEEQFIQQFMKEVDGGEKKPSN
ncbi:hypothetical protein N7510_010094 [Penicillium lagena]|uniref:uncharacterized protein n=1 Tax=Penicillium lagena TaxID=94218 RepID=UPI002541B3E6|nr:uncharacterized protein N7510_010094 [Penicillium lagena]KAJ5604940.1 hypothetical protein N7510_010094 [Penicillium lagena]